MTVLIESKSIDAIYIATPHPFHFDLAFRSLKNKKSVLCEKPMTLTAAEVMVLMYLAKKNNTLLMEAFMYRMHPQTEKIKDILKKELSSSNKILDYEQTVNLLKTNKLMIEDNL